ncbi:MAG: hypothetical protein WD512_01445, partial [Candidatus Paceibacterota bacterium]
MSYQISPNAELDRVLRFKEQVGRLGVSSNFMYVILDMFKNGDLTDYDNKGSCFPVPYDYDDYIRVGLLVICKPEVRPYLSVMKTYTIEWYNIIEFWETLQHEFFYSLELNIKELNVLLKRIMSTERPGIMFESDYHKFIQGNKGNTSNQIPEFYPTPTDPTPEPEPRANPKPEYISPIPNDGIKIDEDEKKMPEITLMDQSIVILPGNGYMSDDDDDNDNHNKNHNNMLQYDSKTVPSHHNLHHLQSQSSTSSNKVNYSDDFMMQSTDVNSVKRTYIPDDLSYSKLKTTETVIDEPINEHEALEIAMQLVNNFEVLNEMKIPTQVAELIIPRIIKKTGGNVNITWTNNYEWQEIYYRGTTEYDTPTRKVPGYLHINEPTNATKETNELAMIQAEKEQREFNQLINN